MKHIALTLSLALVAGPALAQNGPGCTPTEGLDAYMLKTHGEIVLGYGTDMQNRVITIFLNVETGVWTAVMDFPNGQSCRVSDGVDWTFGTPPRGTDI